MAEYPEIDQTDSELFRRTIGEVLPIKQDTVPMHSSRPTPIPARTLADEREVIAALATGDSDPHDIDANDQIQFKRSGVQKRVFQKLQRGQFSIEEQLDLHGMNIDAARDALAAFLGSVRTTGQRCVRIIHGKGCGSKDGKPVLKTHLQSWLRRRNDVLAYCSARPRDGGSGAVYVLIKKQSPR